MLARLAGKFLPRTEVIGGWVPCLALHKDSWDLNSSNASVTKPTPTPWLCLFILGLGGFSSDTGFHTELGIFLP